MKCRKCKNIKYAEEMMVHQYETHGISFDLQRSMPESFPYVKNINEEILNLFWERHKDTGREGGFKEAAARGRNKKIK